MTAKTKKQPFTTFRFERDPGNTKNHRLYAVEKTEYGTLLFFLENEVLEAKHLFHDTHASIASDGPLMSSDNQAERLFAVLNGSWFMLPDDLQAEDVFMLRLWSVKGLKRCLCTYFNKNNILSMPASVENLPECPEETVIARQLAESDLHHYEIQTKDDQSWLVELLEPRPYTDQEQKRIHGLENITDTQTAPGELETNKDSYPRQVNSIQIMDSEFTEVRYMGDKFTLSEQLKETFRWLAECRAIDLEHGKTKSEIESHLRGKGLIEPQASNFAVSGMFKNKLKKLGAILRAEKVSYTEQRYFIR